MDAKSSGELGNGLVKFDADSIEKLQDIKPFDNNKNMTLPELFEVNHNKDGPVTFNLKAFKNPVKIHKSLDKQKYLKTKDG